MSWMGSRPFSVDRSGVQLKLDDPDMVMHF